MGGFDPEVELPPPTSLRWCSLNPVPCVPFFSLLGSGRFLLFLLFPSGSFRFLLFPSGSSGSSLPPPDPISWPCDRFLFTGSGQLPLRPRSKGSLSLTQFLSLCRSAVRSPATGGFVPPDGFTQPSPRLVPAASLVPIVPCSGVVQSPCGSLPHPSRVPADACSITFTRRSEWFAFPLLRLVPLT